MSATHIPSKSEEIAILRETVAKLGPLSYCGPWLSQQIDGIERDIRSDYPVCADYNATVRECAQMKANAESWAKDKLDAAGRVAKEITMKAYGDATAIKARLARDLDKVRSEVLAA